MPVKEWANGWAASIAIAGGVIAIAGGIAAIPAVAGALTIAPALAAGFGIGGGVVALASGIFWKVNSDPADPDYKTVYQPVPVKIPPVQPGDGLPAAAAAVLNAYLAPIGQFTEFGRAFYISINRASAARDAGDSTAYDQQVAAARTYAHQTALALNAWAAKEATLRADLGAAGLANVPVPLGVVSLAQNDILAHGLPAAFSAQLSGEGATVDELAQITSMAVWNPPAPTDLYSLIDPAGAHPILINGVAVMDTFATGSGPNQAPAITGVAPAAGPPGGGNPVTVNGDNLGSVNEIDFGAHPASHLACHVAFCTATAPAGTGTVDVVAKDLHGTSAISPADRYTYLTNPPSLLAEGGFEPSAGIPDESQTGFGEFDFGRSLGPWHVTAAPGVTQPGGVEIVNAAVAQPFTGAQFLKFGELSKGETSGPAQVTQTVPVTVGHQYTLRFALSGDPGGPPTLKRLVASLGSTSQTFTFDATGITRPAQGWVQQALTAPVCSSPVPVTFRQVDAGQYGPDVDNVTLSDEGPTTACGTLPTVTRLVPASGPAVGGTVVTVTGTGLAHASAINFGSKPGTALHCPTDTSCQVTAPAGTGTVDVTVTGPAGTSAKTAADRYTYLGGAVPTVRGVVPSSGPSRGGTRVTVTGTNLAGATVVRFGAVPAAQIACTAGSCAVTAPAGTGTVDVTVTAAGGTSAVGPRDRYTYLATPRPAHWVLVKEGETGLDVRTVQHLLVAHGLPVRVDALFGPQTDAAVRRFQQTHRLTADGQVGDRTWPVLVLQVARGSTGEAVRAAQEQLAARVLPETKGLRSDGLFGPRTRRAVIAFQSWVHAHRPNGEDLTIDGIVGVHTWRALEIGLALR